MIEDIETEAGSGARPLEIAVVGSGISGLSAAWLLSKSHNVTLYEADDRLGGHSNTVDVVGFTDPVPVDTGFIVYNEQTYPNLVALFAHLGVETIESDMSFALSAGDGRFEYAGTNLDGLFAQRRNLLRPRFWRMVADIRRFYRDAPRILTEDPEGRVSLGGYLAREGYSRPFIEDHLLPMGAAIWSTPTADMLDFPATAFVRFFANHALLTLGQRPRWRTVRGGSRSYVERIARDLGTAIRLAEPVTAVTRDAQGVAVETADSRIHYDQVVLACHADSALRLLRNPTADEDRLLGAFRYQDNKAVLHLDETLMPRARRAWSSWNVLTTSGRDRSPVAITYWMNRLQDLGDLPPVFVSLNPARDPATALTFFETTYSHPIFDHAAIAAQRDLWQLQGADRLWFCGSYFGSGFHEDGLQSGLAVAEALGGRKRPWTVEGESSRIVLGPDGRMARHPDPNRKAA